MKYTIPYEYKAVMDSKVWWIKIKELSITPY